MGKAYVCLGARKYKMFWELFLASNLAKRPPKLSTRLQFPTFKRIFEKFSKLGKHQNVEMLKVLGGLF